jgi:hypothetical protein
MIQVTPSDVVKIAPEFSDLAASPAGAIQIESMIDVARTFINEGKWGAIRGQKGLTFLAAHLCTQLIGEEGTGGDSASGPVTSEKVGDLQRSYGSIELSGLDTQEEVFSSTKYGRLFIALRKTITITPMVI